MMKYLTEPEQRELLKAAKTQADALAQRDYHWMAALILTGMRIAEFGRLTAPQVRLGLATGWLVSRKADCKGKRHANDYCVTLQLALHLRALLALSDAVDGELPAGFAEPTNGQPLVWGRGAAPLSVRSYEARLKLWARAAGLDGRISPHWLRHTRGMNVLRHSRGENPLLVAQRALNHASLKSTGVYLHLSREALEQDLQLVDARGRMGKAQARRLAVAGAGVRA